MYVVVFRVYQGK